MPKIMGTSLEQHRLEVRSRLFDSLADLLETQPLESISIAKLAYVSGVGRTAIYNHFSDKEAIVIEFATAETERFLTTLSESLDPQESSAVRLRKYIQMNVLGYEHFHLALGHQLATSLSAEALSGMRPHIKAVYGALASILTEGMGSGEFIEMDVGQAVSLVQACVRVRRVPVEEIESFVMRAILA